MTREEWVAQLEASEKVTFLTFQASDHDIVILHTRDVELTKALAERGAGVRWFDRTHWTSQETGVPNMQAEVVLGPRFWEGS